jgi:hypothetical protein
MSRGLARSWGSLRSDLRGYSWTFANRSPFSHNGFDEGIVAILGHQFSKDLFSFYANTWIVRMTLKGREHGSVRVIILNALRPELKTKYFLVDVLRLFTFGIV